MVRYYESIGLLAPVRRSANGYRVYSESDVHSLAFIRRARQLGFSVEKIGALMALWRDRERSSAEVKSITEKHIAALEAKIEELAAMRRTLEHLVSCCHGDARPDCPIIEGLAGSAAPASAAGAARSSRPKA